MPIGSWGLCSDSWGLAPADTTSPCAEALGLRAYPLGKCFKEVGRGS